MATLSTPLSAVSAARVRHLLMIWTASAFLFLHGANAWEKSKAQEKQLRFDKLPKIKFPTLDMQEIQAEDEANDRLDAPYRLGVAKDMDVELDDDAHWEIVTEGGIFGKSTNVVRFVFSTEDYATQQCKGVKFFFSELRLPGDTKLFLYDPNTGVSVGDPLTSSDNTDNNGQWTSLLLSNEAILELDIPSGVDKADVKLHIAKAYIVYRLPYQPGSGVRGLQAASCHEDVECSGGYPNNNKEAWRDQINSVVALLLPTASSLYTCSAAMINNLAQDGRPLMLTAYHCGIGNNRDTLPSDVEVFFNYQHSNCNGNDGHDGQSVVGTTFVAENSNTDMTLVVLNSQPPQSWGHVLAGWDARGGETNSNYWVGIHHPRFDVKKVSYEDDSVAITSLCCSSSTNDAVVRLDRLDSGEIEGGSSGSPLFNDEGLIIGQLEGGSISVCSRVQFFWYGRRYFYGRIYRSWQDSPAFRAALDPQGTGTMFVAPRAGGATSTPSPTPSPTNVPTASPITQTPTKSPITQSPTTSPTTQAPSSSPTKTPTDSPTTQAPSSSPTKTPTDSPTASPTKAPTDSPTTQAPSSSPTKAPTDSPTARPTPNPTTSSLVPCENSETDTFIYEKPGSRGGRRIERRCRWLTRDGNDQFCGDTDYSEPGDPEIWRKCPNQCPCDSGCPGC